MSDNTQTTFAVEQRGLGGQPAEGQTTLDGGIVRERGDGR